MTRPIETDDARSAARETEAPKRRLGIAWIVLPAVIFAVIALAFALELAL